MNIDNVLNFNSKEKEIDTPVLKIKENILSFEDSFIQISNISNVSISQVNKQSIPKISLILILIVLIMLYVDRSMMKILGIVFIGFGGYIIYRMYEKNRSRPDILSIYLNSGYF